VKVVLVDDDEDIRVICRLSLQTVGGWQVAVASSGPEGIELAARERPDVVLLDVMMPGQDGLTTYAAMRDDPRIAHIPVVLMTAKAQARELARFLALGVAGVIAKPFDPLTLAEEISTILRMDKGNQP
jgi:CheY-like chemotaxis protein